MRDEDDKQAAKRSFLYYVRRGDVEDVRSSLKNYPEFAQLQEGGRSMLHLAVGISDYSTKCREVMAMFLNRGVEVDNAAEDGVTALHLASLINYYNAKDRVSDLINFGANDRARDRDGRTPLHYAAQGGHSDIMELLLARKVEVNLPDEKGVTPLHLAARAGDNGLQKQLMNAGADLQAVTKEGKTVWDYAVEGGHDYQAQVLKAEAGKQKAAQVQQAEAAANPPDPWKLLAPDRVAQAVTEKSLGYRLTEIFNFGARTYTQITQNLSTKTESVAVKTFDEFDDKTAIEKAFRNLERLGGTAEERQISGPIVEKPKRNLKLT